MQRFIYATALAVLFTTVYYTVDYVRPSNLRLSCDLNCLNWDDLAQR